MSAIWGNAKSVSLGPPGGERAVGGRVRGFALRHLTPALSPALRRRGRSKSAARQPRVIRHKPLVDKLLLQHRMAAVANLHHAFVGDLRTAIIVQARGLGEGREHIELRQRRGGLLDFRQLAEHLLAHALEEFVFELHAAFLRAKDFALHLLQLRRDETFAVGNGLLADVMRRHFVEIGLGDLDVVTEDGIEAHLERRDAGARDFVRLQFGNPILAAALALRSSSSAASKPSRIMPPSFTASGGSSTMAREINSTRSGELGKLRFKVFQERGRLVREFRRDRWSV